IVTALPAAVVRAHPELLLHTARTAHLVGRFHRRLEALEQAAALLAESDDRALARAVESELVREQVREGRYAEGLARAVELLGECEPSEYTTRAALLHAAGSATVRMGDMRRAERYLDESVDLYRQAGDLAGLADALIGLGYSVYCYAGEYDLAIARLE